MIRTRRREVNNYIVSIRAIKEASLPAVQTTVGVTAEYPRGGSIDVSTSGSVFVILCRIYPYLLFRAAAWHHTLETHLTPKNESKCTPGIPLTMLLLPPPPPFEYHPLERWSTLRYVSPASPAGPDLDPTVAPTLPSQAVIARHPLEQGLPEFPPRWTPSRKPRP